MEIVTNFKPKEQPDDLMADSYEQEQMAEGYEQHALAQPVMIDESL
jgi:hypothetical protein